jgi:hypothetical protein
MAGTDFARIVGKNSLRGAGMTNELRWMTGAAERRSVPRQRVFKSATLRFNGGYGALEGVIRDLSPKGARLVLGDALGVPAIFEFKMKGEAPRPASVKWRLGNAVGIYFE